jgi:hypothetical protein
MNVYQYWVVEELESWRQTFNNEYPNYMEDAIEHENSAYKTISDLIDKYSNSECTKEDYENILFHLWQSKSE